MGKVIKFLLSFICYVVLIPLSIILTICATWYLLPDFQFTTIGLWLNEQLPGNLILITTCVVVGCTLLFFILSRIFRVVKASKPNNFYTHIITWLLAFVVIAESLFTLFTADSSALEIKFEFDMVRKIGIIAGGALLLLYSILNPKIKKLIDRKIQAYDTAKELNQSGRSSIVWIQILKALDFCFPEFILMVTLCFAFNFQIAIYFIYIIVAFALPILGNMVCDLRVRKEAIRKDQEKSEAQVNATAEAVADLLQQRGKF